MAHGLHLQRSMTTRLQRTWLAAFLIVLSLILARGFYVDLTAPLPGSASYAAAGTSSR